MENEMNHPEDSLSLAMYEYSVSVDSNFLYAYQGVRMWSRIIPMTSDDAKDPAVGPIAGWPVHTSVENSL